MKYPPSFADVPQHRYDERLKELSANSETAFKYLMDINIDEFKNESMAIQGIIFMQLHDELMLFSNKVLIKKLNLLGLTKNELRWFTTIEKIDNEFTMIASKGILMSKLHMLESFKAHLKFKFSQQLLIHLDETKSHDGTIITTIADRLIKIKNRKKYGDGNLEFKENKNNSEAFLQNYMNYIFNDNLDYILELSKGKTEAAILKEIITDGCYYDTKKISQTNFLSAIYDLFKILMPDYHFPTEEEHISSDNYESNYNVFKAKKLKKLILNKKS